MAKVGKISVGKKEKPSKADRASEGPKPGRRRPGGNPEGKKKWAKGTGGYGPLSVEGRVLLELPLKMKEVVGRAASLQNLSMQAFMRRAILKSLMEMKALLQAEGRVGPNSTNFATAAAALRERAEEFLQLLDRLLKQPEIGSVLRDIQKSPLMDDLIRQNNELTERVQTLENLLSALKESQLKSNAPDPLLSETSASSTVLG
jgi:hypothetical protein